MSSIRMQILDKSGIIHVWQIVIHAAVIRTAFNFNISLMFYGEDEKYGGNLENKYL